jgi:hypothetical protein
VALFDVSADQQLCLLVLLIAVVVVVVVFAVTLAVIIIVLLFPSRFIDEGWFRVPMATDYRI